MPYTSIKWGKTMSLTTAAALLAGTLAGCAAKEEDPAAQAAGSDQKKPVEITMLANLYGPNPPQDTIEKLIEEKTNTKLEFTWVPANVYADKLTTGIASNTLPKIVQVASTEFKNTSVINAVRSGMFWEVGPLLKDYPNISKYLNPDIMKSSSYFGKTYGLYYEIDISRQGTQYRKDWLDKLGLKEPKTIDELYEVLKAFTHNDPDGNGQNDTYGLVDRNELPYSAFKELSMWFGTPHEWGEKDGKLTPDFMYSEYMDALKFMKKLYDEKLMNQDFTITSPAQQEEKFFNGKGGMMLGNIFANPDKMKKVNPNAEIDIFNRIEGPKGARNWGGTGMGSLYMFPKTSVKTEEELKGILAFFDKLLEPEVYNLVSFGIEGRHYKKLDDKNVAYLTEAKDLRDNEINPYYNVLHMFNFNYMNVKQTDAISEKKLQLIADNKSIAVMNPAVPLLSATQAEKGTELQKIITDATYKFIIGTINEDGFNKEVDKWRKSGGDKIIEELNKEYQTLKK